MIEHKTIASTHEQIEERFYEVLDEIRGQGEDGGSELNSSWFYNARIHSQQPELIFDGKERVLTMQQPIDSDGLQVSATVAEVDSTGTDDQPQPIQATGAVLITISEGSNIIEARALDGTGEAVFVEIGNPLNFAENRKFRELIVQASQANLKICGCS